MTLFRWLILPLVLILGACSADLSDYKNSEPRFDLFGYFEGETKAWGMVQDYTNKQNRRFDVTIIGTVQDNKLVLVEDFVFDDGEIDQRIWTIEKLQDGSYRGVADDIIGAATARKRVTLYNGSTTSNSRLMAQPILWLSMIGCIDKMINTFLT